jgi:Cys-tRNA(Pro)/Cys-tRNA(Cys) deacylase
VARKQSGGGHTSGGTPATVLLEAAGVEHSLHAYDHDPRAGSYGREAAHALGLDPAEVLKTLVAEADGALVVAVVPVTGELDLKALARALGASRARMADPAAAERSSGYVRGGISPLGQRRRLPTVVDSSALDHDLVYVSAGRRGLDVGLAPTDLVRLTDATVAPVGR